MGGINACMHAVRMRMQVLSTRGNDRIAISRPTTNHNINIHVAKIQQTSVRVCVVLDVSLACPPLPLPVVQSSCWFPH